MDLKTAVQAVLRGDIGIIVKTREEAYALCNICEELGVDMEWTLSFIYQVPDLCPVFYLVEGTPMFKPDAAWFEEHAGVPSIHFADLPSVCPPPPDTRTKRYNLGDAVVLNKTPSKTPSWKNWLIPGLTGVVSDMRHYLGHHYRYRVLWDRTKTGSGDWVESSILHDEYLDSFDCGTLRLFSVGDSVVLNDVPLMNPNPYLKPGMCGIISRIGIQSQKGWEYEVEWDVSNYESCVAVDKLRAGWWVYEHNLQFSVSIGQNDLDEIL